MESSISVRTSDIYHAATLLLQTGNVGLERATRLLESIAGKDGDTDRDVAYSALSSALLKTGDADRALKYANKALEISQQPMYYANLAQVQMYQHKPLEAIESCESGFKALAQADVFDDQANNQLLLKQASAFNMARMYKNARLQLEKLPGRPDFKTYLGMSRMAECDPTIFSAGFQAYGARREAYKAMVPKVIHDSIFRRIELMGYCDWNILLEQGLGDCVMMLPYILDLKKPSESSGHKRKIRIISLDGRHDDFVNDVAKFFCDDIIRAECISSQDLHQVSGGFLWMFDLLVDGIKRQAPYIQMEKQIVDLASQYRGKVGICWRGNRLHQNDHWRSASINDFMPIIDKYGEDCVSLQYGLTQEERQLLNSFQVDKWETKGLTALIAVLSNLKSVITVDTAISHLAGAVGVKCVTLLPTNPDWRWGNHGSESRPYGDSHRLARQIKCGDWSDPVNEAMRVIA